MLLINILPPLYDVLIQCRAVSTCINRTHNFQRGGTHVPRILSFQQFLQLLSQLVPFISMLDLRPVCWVRYIWQFCVHQSAEAIISIMVFLGEPSEHAPTTVTNSVMPLLPHRCILSFSYRKEGSRWCRTESGSPSPAHPVSGEFHTSYIIFHTEFRFIFFEYSPLEARSRKIQWFGGTHWSSRKLANGMVLNSDR